MKMGTFSKANWGPLWESEDPSRFFVVTCTTCRKWNKQAANWQHFGTRMTCIIHHYLDDGHYPDEYTKFDKHGLLGCTALQLHAMVPWGGVVLSEL